MRQTIALAEAGCELVRITADSGGCLRPQGSDAEGACAGAVISCVRGHSFPACGVQSPQMGWKVRINPGNFVEAGIATLDKQNEKEFHDEGRAKVFRRSLPLFARLAPRPRHPV